MKLFLLQYKFQLLLLVLLLTICCVVIFSLGYKIPHGDEHSEWGEFPNHTNQNIIVEEIQNFDSLYPNFKRPQIKMLADQYNFMDHYKTNLKNILSIGFTVTGNKLVLGSAFRFSFNPNSSGGGRVFKTRFDQRGIEYFQINIRKNTCYFKLKNAFRNYTLLQRFYQYNNLKENDTLFFRYVAKDYRAYFKKTPK